MTTLREGLERRPWFGWVHASERDHAESDIERALRAAYKKGLNDAQQPLFTHVPVEVGRGVAAGVAALLTSEDQNHE